MHISGGGSFKPLIFAAFLALNLNAAKAEILPSVAEDFPKGTLDNLEGQTIPGSNPEQTYPSSGYSLYKIQEGGDKPNYFNVVTKFTYNTETGEITPVYYAWDLKNGTFGDGENSVYYGWNRDEETGMIGFIGSKTGYNFEFKEGKYILQPSLFMSYTFVNTFDYRNAAGVQIDSDPMHTIQLNPNIRFITNLKNGWQPYAFVGMVWNLMNETNAYANGVQLPQMSIKPYVEYGVGVQKSWKDRLTGYLQTMLRNGGRNGIAITGGFRFMIGSDSSKNNDAPKVKKEIKSL